MAVRVSTVLNLGLSRATVSWVGLEQYVKTLLIRASVIHVKMADVVSETEMFSHVSVLQAGQENTVQQRLILAVRIRV
jgi:hypothetical protein